VASTTRSRIAENTALALPGQASAGRAARYSKCGEKRRWAIAVGTIGASRIAAHAGIDAEKASIPNTSLLVGLE
jgi:hypothetical protein